MPAIDRKIPFLYYFRTKFNKSDDENNRRKKCITKIQEKKLIQNDIYGFRFVRSFEIGICLSGLFISPIFRATRNCKCRYYKH